MFGYGVLQRSIFKPVQGDCPFLNRQRHGLDILRWGEKDLPEHVQHFNSPHPNLVWEFKYEKEGAYLDLLVMLKDGKMETKICIQSERLYVFDMLHSFKILTDISDFDRYSRFLQIGGCDLNSSPPQQCPIK